MTQSMEGQTMLPAQHEDVEDKRKTCPVRTWAEQHKTSCASVCWECFCC